MKKAVLSRGGVTERICLITLCVIAGVAFSTKGANLIARWKFDGLGPVYADAGPNGISLVQDAATTAAISDAGIFGTSAQLNYQDPGPSTRLSATNSLLATDSFGFAFWLNALSINTNDSLIAMESPYFSDPNTYERMAWQMHVLGNGALEFLVRGDDNSGFGVVSSSANTIMLGTNMPDWIFVAGGYDASSGQLSLYVNTNGFVNTGGANIHSTSGIFDIGTVKNGSDYVAYAAGACIEDMQLYDGPLSAAEAAFLFANPGQSIRTFAISDFATEANGSVSAKLSTLPGDIYTVEASTNLIGFTAVTNFTAVNDFSTINMSKAAIDGSLGSNPRPALFLRAFEQPAPTNFPSCD